MAAAACWLSLRMLTPGEITRRPAPNHLFDDSGRGGWPLVLPGLVLRRRRFHDLPPALRRKHLPRGPGIDNRHHRRLYHGVHPDMDDEAEHQRGRDQQPPARIAV